MKKNILLTASALLIFLVSCKQKEEKKEQTAEAEETTMEAEAPAAAEIIPIEHATAVIEWNGNTNGGKLIFQNNCNEKWRD